MATTEDSGVGAGSAALDLTAEDLQGMAESELDDLYYDAATPEIQELEGKYTGAVVEGRMFPLHSEEALDLLNMSWMPWGGKKFYPIDEEEARGCNWYRIGPFEHNGYGFVGRHTPAVYGPADAYIVDYDLPDNPGALRSVRDEVKRVNDDLYLGRTYMRIRGEHQFLMYFTLEP